MNTPKKSDTSDALDRLERLAKRISIRAEWLQRLEVVERRLDQVRADFEEYRHRQEVGR